MDDKIRVAVVGAKGRMGTETVAAINAENDLILVSAVDQGESLADMLAISSAQVMVDFSVPSAVMGNIEMALARGIVPIVGTTGLHDSDIDHVRSLCRSANTGALIAPNFAIGAVLLMRFCAEAAKYLPDVEIIEMHHERKIDSPSGTAVKTAEMIAQSRSDESRFVAPDGAYEKYAGARGASGVGDVPIHSVRLPGFVASQMVIFGGLGQTLTMRHDSLDRKSFMPGVIHAVRQFHKLKSNRGELIYGLENLL